MSGQFIFLRSKNRQDAKIAKTAKSTKQKTINLFGANALTPDILGVFASWRLGDF